MTATRVRALQVQTTLSDAALSLVFSTARRHPLLWMRRGQGMAAWGEALRLEFSGPDRVRDAAAAWRDIVAEAQVEDAVRVPGTGLIAFGAFAFDDDSRATSVLIVPRVVVGHRRGTDWVTRISVEGDEPADPIELAFGNDYRVPLHAGRMTPALFSEAVAAAVARIEAGELRKVVLARDLVGRMPPDADLRRVLAELALAYPDCWTYGVDGLIGSSPETLVRIQAGTVSARVLAGTASRGRDATRDADAASALARSAKDVAEHAFAVQSVLATLGPHTARMQKSEPFTLELPNLWHLATDVEGVLADDATSLDLVAAMHPTAAVAGTPTDAALAAIRDLEPFDRGRYAGPVGWIDAHGDGEWAIALRCAQVDPDDTVHAYAGCGIVAHSDAAAELTESRMKFRPIVEALA